MRLVLDTNILISALIRESITRKILVTSEIEFLVPEFTFEEINKHKHEILKKSKLKTSQFDLLMATLKENLTIIPKYEIRRIKEAKEIMDNIDPNDTIFIALALSTLNDGIWSDDIHFKKQNVVKVWNTEELIRFLLRK
jgi:putative PIN family toxin of toxin-antitoxin system